MTTDLTSIWVSTAVDGFDETMLIKLLMMAQLVVMMMLLLNMFVVIFFMLIVLVMYSNNQPFITYLNDQWFNPIFDR